MQNIAEFHIIGRIGKIDAAKDVTHLSVAANYNRRDGDEWISDPHWNRVTLFGKLRDRLAKAATGDLVRITGRVRQTSYEAEGTTRYGVDLSIASIFPRVASSILISGGHGRLKPSPGSFFVASMPSLLPLAISLVAWSSTSDGPWVSPRGRRPCCRVAGRCWHRGGSGLRWCCEHSCRRPPR